MSDTVEEITGDDGKFNLRSGNYLDLCKLNQVIPNNELIIIYDIPGLSSDKRVNGGFIVGDGVRKFLDLPIFIKDTTEEISLLKDNIDKLSIDNRLLNHKIKISNIKHSIFITIIYLILVTYLMIQFAIHM